MRLWNTPLKTEFKLMLPNHWDQWLISILKELFNTPRASIKRIKTSTSDKSLICSYKETEFNNSPHFALTAWEITDLKMLTIKPKFSKSTLWLLLKSSKVFYKWKYGTFTINPKLLPYASKKECIKEPWKTIPKSKISKEFYLTVMLYLQISLMNILEKWVPKLALNAWEKCSDSTGKISKP